jgi:hypothetical protein
MGTVHLTMSGFDNDYWYPHEAIYTPIDSLETRAKVISNCVCCEFAIWSNEARWDYLGHHFCEPCWDRFREWKADEDLAAFLRHTVRVRDAATDASSGDQLAPAAPEP